MPKYDKYHPDYGRLYPEIQARPDVLSVLKKSDRKMEYMEVDIKQERFSYDPESKVADLLPSREDSYDRLMEEEHRQFPMEQPTPESLLLLEAEYNKLYRAIAQLEKDEQCLIILRYWHDWTQLQVADKLGISQQAVSYREIRILHKLKKFLEI